MKNSGLLRMLWLLFLQTAARPAYGGQAVVGGVMMKGPKHYTVSLNTLRGLHTKRFGYVSLTKRYRFLGLPFLRGVVMLIEMLFIGYKTIDYSARVAIVDEEEKEQAQGISKQKTQQNAKRTPGRTTDEKRGELDNSSAALLIGTLVVSLLFAIFLFKFLPLGIATLLDNAIGLSSVVFNIIDGVVKAGIFLLYVYLIGRYKDVADLFSYHGAEHKAINCYESGKPLTRSNIMKSSQVHLRCGTTFVFVVLFLSLVVYLFIPNTLPFVYNLLLRLALIPVIAAIAYELQQFSAKANTSFSRSLLRPGLWLQSLTVNTPTPKHVRTGRSSLLALLDAEK